MEWGLLKEIGEGTIGMGGVLQLVVGGIVLLICLIELIASKDENARIAAAFFGFVAVLVVGGGIALLTIGVVNHTAGDSLSELPDGKYVYDVAFMNKARGNSYYIVVRSQPATKDEIPLVQKSVELIAGTHVNVNGVPAHGKLPAAVLSSGELTVVTEKHPPYKWKVYNIKFQEP